MANATFVQSSFLAGEWSQASQGDITNPRYKMAMNVCLNGFPTEQGAWTRRGGAWWAGWTRNGAAGRLHPFDFASFHPYNMEFTDNYVRFWDGTTAVPTNDDQVIVAISAANPAVVQTTTAHGWTTGDQVIFTGLGVNNT